MAYTKDHHNVKCHGLTAAEMAAERFGRALAISGAELDFSKPYIISINTDGHVSRRQIYQNSLLVKDLRRGFRSAVKTTPTAVAPIGFTLSKGSETQGGTYWSLRVEDAGRCKKIGSYLIRQGEEATLQGRVDKTVAGWNKDLQRRAKESAWALASIG